MVSLEGRIISISRRLTRQEIDLLACEVSQGNAAAREFLIFVNKELVEYAVSRYVKYDPSMSQYQGDLVQYGMYGDKLDNGGLARAVELFVPREDAGFSTYVWWWIMASVKRAAGRIKRIGLFLCRLR